MIRIACRELESWYLGDLAAVEQALHAKGIANLQNKRQYRHPDTLDNPKQELRRLAPSYQPISGSREMGKTMDPHHNRSHSFNVFMSGIHRILNETKNV